MSKFTLFFSFLIFATNSFSQIHTTTSKPDICDCINQDQEKISEACEKLRTAWLQEYEKSEVDHKRAMEKSFQDCKDQVISSLSDDQICYCGDIYGQIYDFKITGEGSDVFDKFEEDNKIAVDSCRKMLEQIDAKSWHLFFKRAVKCDNLTQFFDNPKHYFYQQIQNINKTESIDTLNQKLIPVNVYKSINEISDKEICDCVHAKNNMTQELSTAGGDSNTEEQIRVKYKAIKKKCEGLSTGLTEEDHKLLLEKARNCSN